MVKNESELAYMLGTGLAGYANKVQNGHIRLYRDFLNGKDQVAVTIRLVDTGGVIVEEGPDVDGYKAEIKALEETVKEQKAEIKSLNILVEESIKEKEEPTEGPIGAVEAVEALEEIARVEEDTEIRTEMLDNPYKELDHPDLLKPAKKTKSRRRRKKTED